jgi:hypothetical protein
MRGDGWYSGNMPSGSGIAIGLVLAVAIGYLMHNMGAGIAVGVAIGVSLEAWNRKK